MIGSNFSSFNRAISTMQRYHHQAIIFLEKTLVLLKLHENKVHKYKILRTQGANKFI
jgi:hypothetical protein